MKESEIYELSKGLNAFWKTLKSRMDRSFYRPFSIQITLKELKSLVHYYIDTRDSKVLSMLHPLIANQESILSYYNNFSENLERIEEINKLKIDEDNQRTRLNRPYKDFSQENAFCDFIYELEGELRSLKTWIEGENLNTKNINTIHKGKKYLHFDRFFSPKFSEHNNYKKCLIAIFKENPNVDCLSSFIKLSIQEGYLTRKPSWMALNNFLSEYNLKMPVKDDAYNNRFINNFIPQKRKEYLLSILRKHSLK